MVRKQGSEGEQGGEGYEGGEEEWGGRGMAARIAWLMFMWPKKSN